MLSYWLDFYLGNKLYKFYVTNVVFMDLLCIILHEFKIMRVKNTIIIDMGEGK